MNPLRFSFPTIALATALIAGLLGCAARRPVYDRDYAALAADWNASRHRSAAPAPAPVVAELAGPHPVEQYISAALSQNPEVQAARKRVDALANRVPQAASLEDPMLGVTVFAEQVETAAGQQDASVSASQKVPFPGKLRLQGAQAEAETEIARAWLAATELQVIADVKHAYFALYFVQQAIRITEEDRRLLEDLTKVAESKYKAGNTSQQDVLRAQVEVSLVDKELVDLRQQLASVQAELARLLHISPDTDVRALEELPVQDTPQDLQRLYELAIRNRPELQAKLAAVLRDRRSLDLARMKYFPDVTMGVSWISTADRGLSPVANGRDPVLLTMNMNLPIYRKKLRAGLRSAEAHTVATAREYDSLKDRTQEEVKDLFVQAKSQQELIALFREQIVPKAEQTFRISLRAYQAGDVDFLQLIDNWRQLLRFQLSLVRLESQLRQTLARLERVLGRLLKDASLEAAPPLPPAPAPE